MKIFHVPYGFPPDQVGGTEVYVSSLAAIQAERGFDVRIAAPSARTSRYSHSGLTVHRFRTSQTSVEDLYGEGDSEAAAGFAEILDADPPDLVHLHSFTSAVSVKLARQVKSRRIPLVFTYHTPTVSCARGTLLRWGNEICDGKLDAAVCAACTLHGLGMPRPASRVLAGLPDACGRTFGTLPLGGMATAVRMRELMESRIRAIHGFLAEADRVVAVCQWLFDLLLRNGVPREKLRFSRQGLAWRNEAASNFRQTAARSECCRIAFLGRIHPTKGIDVLMDAVLAEPELALELDIYGVVAEAEGRDLRAELVARAAGDGRIRFLEPRSGPEIRDVLGAYNLVAVPSQWLETGPLVVYEAFGAGVPVLGSNLGGIAELVQNETDGLLVEPGSVQAWQNALRRVVREHGLLEQLRSGVRPPREMTVVADEMTAIYEELLGEVKGSVACGASVAGNQSIPHAVR